jgi:uncharacterized protein (UPF0276 family)
MRTLPELGIGIIYFRGFEPFLEQFAQSIDVIELEPQTLWYEAKKKDAFGIDGSANQFLKELNLPILFHGVGAPIAGSQRPSAKMIRTLQEHIAQLAPLSFSEHLSFNSFRKGSKVLNTNFLLPPLQNERGIKAILRNIECYKKDLGLPFAFETGVNYLKPCAGDMEDGRFVLEVAERADCNILLDLHNVLVNHKNGRQPIQEFLSQLPKERVTELHLANGFFHKGYYLDAHSGTMSTELSDITMELVKSLPNLKAIIFEMLPDYVEKVSKKDFEQQLIQMRRIWDARGKGILNTVKAQRESAVSIHDISIKEWEQNIGSLALQRQADNMEWTQKIAEDEGLEIIRDLIYLFRGSALVSNLQLSTRLLRLALGEDVFKSILASFFEATAPELFPYKTAMQFAAFVKGKYDIRYLDRMLAYEIAGIRVRSEGRSRKVPFDFNPFPVIRSLTNAELPLEQDIPMKFLLTIQSDEKTTSEDLLRLEAVFHS